MYVPVMKHAQRLGRHAVDAPLRVAVVVADGYREATVIGTDQMDQLAVFTLDLQRLAFARVGRVIAGLFCENKQNRPVPLAFLLLSTHLHTHTFIAIS